MEPTYRPGQTVIVSGGLGGAFSRGDVIAFTMPFPGIGVDVKRIIAVPGDRLKIYKGLVSVNGRPIAEPYTRNRTPYDISISSYKIYVAGKPLDRSVANIPGKTKWIRPDRLPPNCYFVLGDNRALSVDSHDFGCAYSGTPFSSGMLAGQASRHFEAVVTR